MNYIIMIGHLSHLVNINHAWLVLLIKTDQSQHTHMLYMYFTDSHLVFIGGVMMNLRSDSCRRPAPRAAKKSLSFQLGRSCHSNIGNSTAASVHVLSSRQAANESISASSTSLALVDVESAGTIGSLKDGTTPLVI